MSYAGADIGFTIGGAPTLQGVPTYDFAKISEKLHEIEKILVRGGGGAPPLRSATDMATICQIMSKYSDAI